MRASAWMAAAIAVSLAGCGSSHPVAVDDSGAQPESGTADASPTPDGGDGGTETGGGCGSGTAMLSGTIDGQTFAPNDALYQQYAPTQTSWIVLVDTPNVCASGDAGVSTGLGISLSALTLQPGTYSATSTTKSFNAEYCSPSGGGLQVMGGTVTITKVDACGVTGSFDLQWAGSSETTGTFYAPACAGPLLVTGCL